MNPQMCDVFIMFKDGSNEEFKEAYGYQLGSGFIGVMVGNTTHIYPQERIQYITVTNKE